MTVNQLWNLQTRVLKWIIQMILLPNRNHFVATISEHVCNCRHKFVVIFLPYVRLSDKMFKVHCQKKGMRQFSTEWMLFDSISCLMHRIKWGLINLAILIRSVFFSAIELCISQFVWPHENYVIVGINYFRT